RSDVTLSPSLREAALAVAVGWKEPAFFLNNVSWEIVRFPGRSPADYDRALRAIEAAGQLEPEDGDFLYTLGVAQYRVGQYEKALSTLTRSNQLNGNGVPADLTFLAMALHRLGQNETARATLNRLREVMKNSEAGASAENQAVLREANRLV